MEVKLAQLEDDLDAKGYGEDEIADMLVDARARFEKEANRGKGKGTAP